MQRPRKILSKKSSNRSSTSLSPCSITQRICCKRHRTVVVSADYDRSSSILFKKQYEALEKNLLTTQKTEPNKLTKNELAKVAGIKKRHANGLDFLAAQSLTKLELYFGTARQDRDKDWNKHKTNHNGLCHSNYEKYCKEKNWLLRPLLLGDKEDQKGNPLKKEKKSGQAFTYGYQCKGDPYKVRTLLYQLEEASHHHHDKRVAFYFIDDNPGIINEVSRYFFRFPEKIPQNVDFHIIRFDFYEEIQEHEFKSSINPILQYFQDMGIFGADGLFLLQARTDQEGTDKRLPCEEEFNYLQIFSAFFRDQSHPLNSQDLRLAKKFQQACYSQKQLANYFKEIIQHGYTLLFDTNGNFNNKQFEVFIKNRIEKYRQIGQTSENEVTDLAITKKLILQSYITNVFAANITHQLRQQNLHFYDVNPPFYAMRDILMREINNFFENDKISFAMIVKNDFTNPLSQQLATAEEHPSSSEFQIVEDLYRWLQTNASMATSTNKQQLIQICLLFRQACEFYVNQYYSPTITAKLYTTEIYHILQNLQKKYGRIEIAEELIFSLQQDINSEHNLIIKGAITFLLYDVVGIDIPTMSINTNSNQESKAKTNTLNNPTANPHSNTPAKKRTPACQPIAKSFFQHAIKLFTFQKATGLTKNFRVGATGNLDKAIQQYTKICNKKIHHIHHYVQVITALFQIRLATLDVFIKNTNNARGTQIIKYYQDIIMPEFNRKLALFANYLLVGNQQVMFNVDTTMNRTDVFAAVGKQVASYHAKSKKLSQKLTAKNKRKISLFHQLINAQILGELGEFTHHQQKTIAKSLRHPSQASNNSSADSQSEDDESKTSTPESQPQHQALNTSLSPTADPTQSIAISPPFTVSFFQQGIFALNNGHCPTAASTTSHYFAMLGQLLLLRTLQAEQIASKNCLNITLSDIFRNAPKQTDSTTPENTLKTVEF